jgi:hypothetical protein
MASQFHARRRPGRYAARPVQLPRPTRALPPAAVVDAVLRFHDVALDQGGERTLLRLSEQRLREPEVEAALGADAGRAANVSILWNERESQIVRVLEGSLAA